MATTVRTLQNFIGGDWVEATGDSAREIVSPVTGEKLADAPNASAEDVDRAARAAREAQPRLGRAVCVGPRQGLPCDCRPDRGAEGRLRARALPRAGKALRGRGDSRHRRDGRELPYRRRGREADGIRGHPVPGRQQADPHLPQAERRLRLHHALELPDADPGRADRARDRRREHDRDEALRVDPDRDGELHADHGGGRASRRAS